MHAGRSSQDIHATYRAATLREKALEVADGLLTVMKTIEKLAIKHRGVVLPNYTNGVAAQPNAYSHYLIAFLYGFLRKFRSFGRNSTEDSMSARWVQPY